MCIRDRHLVTKSAEPFLRHRATDMILNQFQLAECLLGQILVASEHFYLESPLCCPVNQISFTLPVPVSLGTGKITVIK